MLLGGKSEGVWGVARSMGKEHLFWGSDSGILSSVNIGEMGCLFRDYNTGHLTRKRLGYP